MLHDGREWLVSVLLLGALIGCMKPAASVGPAPLVIPVAGVSGTPVSIGGPVESPHLSNESDGHVAGEHVLVESHGTWLQATLVERRGARWLVRYETGAFTSGPLDALEELVEPARIRPPVEPVDQEHSPDDGDP